MGKLKKRSKLSQQRRKQNQLLPGDNKSNKKLENKEVQKITPLISQLSASATNDRSIALSTILLLCDNDPQSRKLFLKNNLVKILLTKLIHDESDEIVVDAYGLLRNLIIEEGYDLSVHLWRSDIWTALEADFKKAMQSLPHINDEKVSSTRKALLIDYIDNLISCLGSLSTEVSIQLFDENILPKLQQSGILKFIFELIEKRVSNKLTLTALEFLYDLSTLSFHFIELFANEPSAIELLSNIEDSTLSVLSQVYLVGLKFQIMEFKGELTDAKSDDVLIDSILGKLDSLYKAKVDLKTTVEQLDAPLNPKPTKEEENALRQAKNNFKLIDLLLDLYTTIIEVKGEQQVVSPSSVSKETKQRLSAFFSTGLAPFLSDLITTNFKNSKILVCLNNLSLYLSSLDLVDESYITFLTQVGSVIAKDFNETLAATVGDDVNLDTISDELNFLLFYDQAQGKISADAKLVSLLITLSNAIDFNNHEANQIIQFSTVLISYLTLIGKGCDSIDTTQEISKFIVDTQLLGPIKLYKSFRNTSELHKKFKFLVEYTLLNSINAIFEMFDDDYPYNRPVFHEGGLLKIHQVQED
ncbi:unnamed protein product [Ambrosiozyma monospora]|uniref:Unnamed protein product n=1 Tax=Ambrosiozyma monospora TaxID=43982 RepID=A0A9W6YS94_AMBMO|nr:unnamed protein product [Ambrosiozyma monospora]